MSYVPRPSLAVANFFIDKGVLCGRPVDPMKLQKLVYFAHGWHLAVFGEPLIDEFVEAWQYGPVIPTIYHEFKRYGAKPIDWPAFDDQGAPYRLASDDDAVPVLERVWSEFGGYSGIQLSDLSHEPDGPWDRVNRAHRRQGISRGRDIPNGVIRDAFREKAVVR